jgi:hypothetical protein
MTGLNMCAAKCFLDYFQVYITKSQNAPGFQNEKLIFCQPMDGFTELFSKKGRAETDFLKNCLTIFQHGVNFCHKTPLDPFLLYCQTKNLIDVF